MLYIGVLKRNPVIRIFVLTFCLVYVSALKARPEPVSFESLTARLDYVFNTWDRFDVPGFAIAVIQNGNLVYERYFGMADLEERIPITSETVFHIASVSKQFTAACIALLIIQGKISLDDHGTGSDSS